jgi:alkylhydroperoxidase family enzyme
MQHHLASSKRAGLTPQDWQSLKDPVSSGFSDQEKIALAFAEKLTRAPWEVTDAHIGALKQFFSDPQIVDIHLLVGLSNLTNRFTDPLGLELETPAEQI